MDNRFCIKLGVATRIFFSVILLALFSVNVSYAACIKANPPTVSHDDYYATAEEKVGDDLKAALNQIIKGHKKFSYTPCVWEILKEADEDHNNSSNIITIYTQRSVPKSRQDSGANDPDSWNREHIWAKSHGFKRKGQHAHTDAHHIRAADRSVNSDRSNNDFDNGGQRDDECAECFEGDGTWEAPNRVKGDIARMMFYMAVRYEGDDNSNTPDLKLVDRLTHSNEPFFGKLCTLIQWHKLDPVSDEERRRNDVVYSWQGNRNPFIDRPEYVRMVWNDVCEQTSDNKDAILQQIEKIESELNTLRNQVENTM